MQDNNKLIDLGFCTKPHGMKGGFTFTLFNSDDSSLKTGSIVIIFPKKTDSSVKPEGESYVIENISYGNKVIVYLQGVDNRDQVEAMIPFDIKVDRSELPELKEDGEYYISDLLGLEVFEHGTGRKIGFIKNYYENGAQIVFTIITPNEKFDIVFNNVFFPVVDVEQNRVEIVVPEVIDEK